ncbi:hypothetical protein TNCV_168141 [Trichonephila clavipes]|nr:hypothetical protein TNCV_168141 [Trichonephila clavipes]
MLEQREKQKEEQEILKTQRRKALEAKKGVKKLKPSFCRPKSIKSRPISPVASTSKDGVIRCPACAEEYYDLTTEEWIPSAVNAKSGGMRKVPIMKMTFLFVTIVSCTTKHFNITLQCIMLSLILCKM